MRENCTSGSVRGAPGNGRSYRERMKKEAEASFFIPWSIKVY
jgi:hypothetical protein